MKPMDWHKMVCWVISHKGYVSFAGVVTFWGVGMKIRRRVLDWHDAPVLTLIKNAKAICTPDFIAENLPKRSKKSLLDSIRRLENSGKIHALGVGYVSSEMQKRLDMVDRQWDR